MENEKLEFGQKVWVKDAGWRWKPARYIGFCDNGYQVLEDGMNYATFHWPSNFTTTDPYAEPDWVEITKERLLDTTGERFHVVDVWIKTAIEVYKEHQQKTKPS